MKGKAGIICLGIVILLGIFFIASFDVAPAHAKRTLVGYTAASGSVEAIYVEAFKKKYPDIDFKTINLSSGPVTSRLIAEKSNAQCDVVFGLMELYLKALKDMMKDDDHLYSTLIKNQYSLGKILAQKFRLVKIAYNVFMIGIIITVIIFLLNYVIIHG